MIQFLGPIANLAGTWLEGKVEEKKAVAGAKVARAKAEATIAEKQATGEIDYDLTAAKQMESSWRDEFFSLLFAIPMVLAFCGEWGREIVFSGFQALQQMPQWYQVSLGALVASSVGMRGITKFYGKKK
jgi:hypothetical protein|tara:strand:+ start:235 stop:621 length:387 start_codon:yes stop_codon:yes gene_type:complete